MYMYVSMKSGGDKQLVVWKDLKKRFIWKGTAIEVKVGQMGLWFYIVCSVMASPIKWQLSWEGERKVIQLKGQQLQNTCGKSVTGLFQEKEVK